MENESLILTLANKPRKLFSLVKSKRLAIFPFLSISQTSPFSKTSGTEHQEHLKNILNKVNETIGLLRKLQNILPREPLLTIYKSFVRPHLDYGDVIHDQHYNNSFHQKLESMQYNAALAITGAIRGSSREKLYQELGLESLKQRRWFRKLCYFFKITKNQSPKYLFDKIPTTRTAYRTRNNIGNIPRFNVKHIFFLRTRSSNPL